MVNEVIRVDAALPRDEEQEAALLTAAEQVAPGDLLALFRMNWLQKELADDRRHDEDSARV